MFNKICRCLDSNPGPLVLEATALSTTPQSLPKCLRFGNVLQLGTTCILERKLVHTLKIIEVVKRSMLNQGSATRLFLKRTFDKLFFDSLQSLYTLQDWSWLFTQVLQCSFYRHRVFAEQEQVRVFCYYSKKV